MLTTKAFFEIQTFRGLIHEIKVGLLIFKAKKMSLFAMNEAQAPWSSFGPCSKSMSQNSLCNLVMLALNILVKMDNYSRFIRDQTYSYFHAYHDHFQPSLRQDQKTRVRLAVTPLIRKGLHVGFRQNSQRKMKEQFMPKIASSSSSCRHRYFSTHLWLSLTSYIQSRQVLS